MLTTECERLELSHLIKDRKVFCTMNYYRKIFPDRKYGLVDVYIYLRDKNELQTVRFTSPVYLIIGMRLFSYLFD
jgi:hypothetical protein